MYESIRKVVILYVYKKVFRIGILILLNLGKKVLFFWENLSIEIWNYKKC